MQKSSLWASRAAKPWQGRTLENSGGSGARFWSSAVLREGSSLLVSRAAKPWQGRTLEGSGGSGACFWSSAVLREGSSLLVSRAAKPCQGRTLEGFGGSGVRLDPRGFAWKSRHFCSRGPRNRGRGVL